MDEKRNRQTQHEGSSRIVHRDERRHSLVVAAYRLIAEKGFEQLRTRDIAASVKVNIATLHYYFATKEDLIQAVVDYLLDEFHTISPLNVVLDDTPLGEVQAMFLMTYERFHSKPEMFTVLSELVLRSLRDQSIQPAIQNLDTEWHAYLSSVITAGIQQGIFRAELEPEHTATRLITLLKGFFFHQISSPKGDSIEQLLDDVKRLILI